MTGDGLKPVAELSLTLKVAVPEKLGKTSQVLGGDALKSLMGEGLKYLAEAGVFPGNGSDSDEKRKSADENKSGIIDTSTAPSE